MVKHSPNDRLRLLQQRQQVTADTHPVPELQNQAAALPAQDGLPPVDEVLRRAAEVRAEAEAQDRGTFSPNPNVTSHRGTRGGGIEDINLDDIHIHDEDGGVDGDDGDAVGDDLGASFAGDAYPEAPPPWLSQVINAAVTAAATAVAALPQRQPPPSRTLAPTKLSDRKVPDFWESQPEEWFRIFDAHLAFFRPSEDAAFNTLLPLLTPTAISKMTPILRVPGRQPYTTAKATLLKHFAKTPRDLARELRDLRSLGDNKPSEILAHIRGLLPDPDVLFEVVLLDLLPPNARDAALQHSTLDAMAAAADLIVAENAVSVSTPVVAAVDGPSVVPQVDAVAASSPDLCPVHARYGKAAYRCSSPSTCRMKNVIRQRPPPRAQPAQGNSKAGGRS